MSGRDSAARTGRVVCPKHYRATARFARSNFGLFATCCHRISSGLGTLDMTLPLLRLFVYGSLKRGFDNHHRYCRGVRSVEETNTAGKLYRLPTGYPALVLPRKPVSGLGRQGSLRRPGKPAAARPKGRFNRSRSGEPPRVWQESCAWRAFVVRRFRWPAAGDRRVGGVPAGPQMPLRTGPHPGIFAMPSGRRARLDVRGWLFVAAAPADSHRQMGGLGSSIAQGSLFAATNVSIVETLVRAAQANPLCGLVLDELDG